MVSVAEAQLEIAQRNLGDAEVKAPFDGVVGERIANQGESLPIDGKILALLDTSHVEVAAQMPAADVVRLKVDQPVTVTLEGFGDREFQGRITRISPTAQPGSRSIPVYVEITDRHDALRGGLFAMGSVVVAEKGHALAVPAAADAQGRAGRLCAGRRERRAGQKAGRRRAHLVARRARRGEGPGIGHDHRLGPPARPEGRPAGQGPRGAPRRRIHALMPQSGSHEAHPDRRRQSGLRHHDDGGAAGRRPVLLPPARHRPVPQHRLPGRRRHHQLSRRLARDRRDRDQPQDRGSGQRHRRHQDADLALAGRPVDRHRRVRACRAVRRRPSRTCARRSSRSAPSSSRRSRSR